MKQVYNSYRLEVVKEKTIEYLPKTIKQKEHVVEEVAEILEKTFNVTRQCEEVFYLITLNGAHEITGLFEVSRGLVNLCQVHPREVYKRAIQNNAVSIIVAHNHPSGNLEPSSQDRGVTTRLKESGELLGIKLLDHVIMGSDGKSLSFSEEGYI